MNCVYFFIFIFIIFLILWDPFWKPYLYEKVISIKIIIIDYVKLLRWYLLGINEFNRLYGEGFALIIKFVFSGSICFAVVVVVFFSAFLVHLEEKPRVSVSWPKNLTWCHWLLENTLFARWRPFTTRIRIPLFFPFVFKIW